MTAPTFDNGQAIYEALKAPEVDGEENIQEMVNDAGWEVSAVNWIFEQVTGESLVEKVIMPITGDFNKIEANADAWKNVGISMDAFAKTMMDNANTVNEHWKGDGASAHEVYIDGGWRLAFKVEKGIANVIGKGFEQVAKVSKKLCAKALELLKKLVRKLIEAVAESWIPVYGWVRAVDMVWSAYQIFQMIMEIIEMVKNIIEAAKEIAQSVKAIGSQLAKIKDVRDPGDLVEIVGNIADEGGDINKARKDIRDNAVDIADKGREIGTTARDAKDDYDDTTAKRDRAEDRQNEGRRREDYDATRERADSDEAARREEFDRDHRERAERGETEEGEIYEEQRRREEYDQRSEADDLEEERLRRAEDERLKSDREGYERHAKERDAEQKERDDAWERRVKEAKDDHVGIAVDDAKRALKDEWNRGRQDA